jgi:hypothetical protein
MSKKFYIVVAIGRHEYSDDREDRKIVMDYVFEDKEDAEEYAKKIPSIVGRRFYGEVECLTLWSK